MRPPRVLPAAALALLLSACATVPPPPVAQGPIGEILASPDRRPADRTNDARRKAPAMLAFIGARPGMVTIDLSAGGGYTTELLARSVGPTGKVYGQSRPRPGNPSPAALAERAKNPAVANIVPVERPFEDPVPPGVAPGTLDLATLMFNYHDLVGAKVDRAKMNLAVFTALKSGGTYVVADHSGRPGTGASEVGTLHRIEESFLQKEIEAAGFRLAEQGNFLRNPDDPRDKETPVPAMPKDEFVLKFVKP